MQQLQSFSSAHPVAWGWSPGVLAPHRNPASTLAVSQGFLAFSLCNLVWNLVVLACKRTSVPPPTRQEARGRSKGKSTRAKYRAGKFPASRLQLKASPPPKKNPWDYYCWLGSFSLPLKKFYYFVGLHRGAEDKTQDFTCVMQIPPPPTCTPALEVTEGRDGEGVATPYGHSSLLCCS